MPTLVLTSLFVSLLVVSTPASQTGPSNTSPAASHPILVELFTSEGCSSCPPADALLEKLDGAQPSPGTHLIVLSEHVDYWDHDGWKDPNSSPAMTERQAAYVHALGLQTPYTPQMIVDGTGLLRVGDAQQIMRVFQDHGAAPKDLVQISKVSVDASTPDSVSPSFLQARIEATGSSGKRKADVYVAIALDRFDSEVARGENAGRRLRHVAVVQQITKVGTLQQGKSFDQTVRLKLRPGTDQKNIRIVAFVQEPGPGRLLGAAQWKPAI